MHKKSLINVFLGESLWECCSTIFGSLLCYVMLCSMIFGNLLCFFIIVFAGFIAIFLWALPDTNKD